MLRSFFLLSSLFLLIGCESEFDKCMNAELPRAEAGLRPGIEEAQKHLTAADRLISREMSLLEILKPLNDWIEKNPQEPPSPRFSCNAESEDWAQCYKAHRQAKEQWEIDVQPWRDRREAVFIPLLPALKTAGFEGASFEEVIESAYEGSMEPYQNAVVARAQDLGCWGREGCEDASGAFLTEFQHRFGEDSLSRDAKSITPEQSEWMEARSEGVKQHFTDKIASIKANAPEIATLMCNRAGIYE